MSIYTIHRQFHLYMIYYPLIHPNISNFVCYSLAIRCTLYSPLFSNGFQWTFTGPSQFQRTQWTVCWTGPNSAACLVQVQSKSSEVILKQKSIGQAGLASPVDFCWTSNGFKGRKEGKYDKSLVHQTSTGLLMVLAS